MMPVAIDPSEMRRNAAAPAARGGPGLGRILLYSGLGGLGLVALSAGAYTLLSGLAGPQISKVRIGPVAANWPDLRDGVPALAPTVNTLAAKAPPADPTPLVATAAPAVAAPTPVAAPAPVVAARPVEAAPQTLAAANTLAAVSAPAKAPARVPPLETATVLPPARPANLIGVGRTAALVPPLAAETTRSRATSGTFTALPPEPRETASPRKKPVATALRAKPVSPVKTADAAPVAEAEPEQTEVFGVKVPSFAPAGRKIAEGVEAMGNAIKNLPSQFQ